MGALGRVEAGLLPAAAMVRSRGSGALFPQGWIKWDTEVRVRTTLVDRWHPYTRLPGWEYAVRVALLGGKFVLAEGRRPWTKPRLASCLYRGRATN